MNPLVRYWRIHRWQMRILTLLLTAVVAIILAGWVVLPWQRHREALATLRGDGPDAVKAVATRAYLDPRLREQLRADLASAEDELFAKLMDVFDLLATRLDDPREPALFDRDRLIRYRQIVDDPNYDDRREELLGRAARQSTGSDWLAQLAMTATSDPYPPARAEAAVLAGRFALDEALAELAFADASPQVRSRATAVLSLRGAAAGYLESLTQPLDIEAPFEEAIARAYALSPLAPSHPAAEAALAEIAEAAAWSDDEAAAARLIWAANHARGPGPIVLAEDAELSAGPPWTMAMVAGALAGDQQVGPLAILALAGPEDPNRIDPAFIQRQAAGAFAAGRLRLPVAGRLAGLIRNYYHPATAWSMAHCALAAGELLTDPTVETPPAVAEETLEILSLAAADDRAPLAQAAAAYALWRVDPQRGREAMLLAAENQDTIGADWLTWRLARHHPAEAANLAEALLRRRYSPPARAAGAILLGLVTRGTEAQSAALARLTEQFRPSGAAMARDVALRESFRCALLLAGDDSQRQAVRGLLPAADLTRRRVLTALLLSDDPVALNWLLARPTMDAARLDSILGSQLVGEVLAAARPGLPLYQPLAPATVRLAQAQMILDAWALSQPGQLGD